MFRKYLIPFLAVVGVGFAIFVVKAGAKKTPVAAPVAPPTLSPYKDSIAGAGLVEASTENISIGTFVPGVASEVFVKEGQHLDRGQPLFRIDDRDLQADAAVKQAALVSAKAKVGTMQASYDIAKALLERYESITDPRAVSQEEKDRRYFAARQSEATLAQAKADVESAAAQLEATKTDIDRRLVKAPVYGEVMQVNVRPGEYVMAGPTSNPPILFGATSVLHVRVDIDENDAWRLRPDARAVAAVRGNRDLKTELKFVRVEPFVVPKKSLTGESTERVDTRVLQVLYAFPRGNLPMVYVGQQMDVWIEDLTASNPKGPASMQATTQPATQPTTRTDGGAR